MKKFAWENEPLQTPNKEFGHHSDSSFPNTNLYQKHPDFEFKMYPITNFRPEIRKKCVIPIQSLPCISQHSSDVLFRNFQIQF